MSIGKLRDRVVLQQRSSQRNSFGESVEVWTDVATVWAEVKALRGYERTEAYLANARSSWRLVIRHRAAVTPAMRVQLPASFGSLILEIKSVLPIDRDYLEIIGEALQ